MRWLISQADAVSELWSPGSEGATRRLAQEYEAHDYGFRFDSGPRDEAWTRAKQALATGYEGPPEAGVSDLKATAVDLKGAAAALKRATTRAADANSHVETPE